MDYIIACQVPLFMEFSRQFYWNGWPFPSPGGQTQVSCIAGGFFYHLSHQGIPVMPRPPLMLETIKEAGRQVAENLFLMFLS